MSLSGYLDAERDAARAASVERVRVPPSQSLGEPSENRALPWEARVERIGKPLSPREIRLLEVVRDGATNKQAAYVMGVTEQTIKNFMMSILSKLGAADRTHAVILAIRSGLVSLQEGVPSSPTGLSPMMMQSWCDDLDARLERIAEYTEWLRERVASTRTEAVALVVAPRGRPARIETERIPGVCAIQGCEAPLAAKKPGPGRPPTRCETHVHRREDRAA